MTPKDSSDNEIVTVTDWVACYNSGENVIALSCTVSSAVSSPPMASITGVGLIINDADGNTLGSFYTSLSSGNESVYPAFNLPPGKLKVGDGIMGVVQGECDGKHFFFEEELTIGKC